MHSKELHEHAPPIARAQTAAVAAAAPLPLAPHAASAQTSLTAGDVAVIATYTAARPTGSRSSRSLTAPNTTIYFTDSGWTGTLPSVSATTGKPSENYTAFRQNSTRGTIVFRPFPPTGHG